MADNYLSLHGVTGNYALTPNKNLFDSDTGNGYQSIGNWIQNVGGLPTVVADASAEAFGGTAIEHVTPSGSNFLKTAASAAVNVALSPATEYTFVIWLKADVTTPATQFTVQLDWRDAADASLGTATGTGVPLVAGEYIKVFVTGTSPALTAYARTYIAKTAGGELDGTQTFHLGLASLHEGASIDIVPSYKIVGDIEYSVRARAVDWDAASDEWLIGTYPSADGFGIRRYNNGNMYSYVNNGVINAYGIAISTLGLVDGEAHTIRTFFSEAERAWWIDGVEKASGGGVSQPYLPMLDDLSVGAVQDGATAWDGDIYWAEVRDGVGGPVVYRVDFTDVSADQLKAAEIVDDHGRVTSLLGDEWAYVRPVTVGLLGETKLVLQSEDGNKGYSPMWADRSENNHHAENGSAAGADANDALAKNYDAAEDQYMYTPGVNFNWASTPVVNLLDADNAHLYQSKGDWFLGTGITWSATGGEFGGKLMAEATAGQTTLNPSNPFFPVTANSLVTVSVRTRVIDGGTTDDTCKLKIWTYVDGAGGVIESVNGATAEITGEWTTFTATVQLTGGANSVRPQLDVFNNSTVAEMSSCMVSESGVTVFVPSFNIQSDLEMEWKGRRVEWVGGGNSGQMVGTRNAGSIGYHMISQAESGGNSRIYMRFGNGTLQRAANMNFGEALDPDTTYTVKTTFEEGVGWELYLDGVNVDTVSSTDAGPGISTSAMGVGARPDGGSTAFDGDTFYALVRDGIGGPVVARFDAKRLEEPFAGYTDTQRGNVWTIGRGASGMVTTIVERDKWLFHTDKKMSVLHHADIDFDDTDDFTVLWWGRPWPNNAAGNRLLSKRSTEGYVMLVGNPEGTAGQMFLDGATTGQTAEGAAGIPTLTAAVIVGRREAGVKINVFTDGVTGPDKADSTGTTATTSPLHIGTSGTGLYYDGELFAIAIWDRLLTDDEIVQAGRELVNLPIEAAGRHGDGLLNYIRRNYPNIKSPTVVGALNEWNGLTAPPRKEYKEARDTAFGINGH